MTPILETTMILPADRKIYIAGPMRNHPHQNFPQFFQTEEALRNYFGNDAVIYNPARMDMEHGLSGEAEPSKPELVNCIMRDLYAISHCNTIVMLRGWQTSKGARAEHALAEFLELDIIYADNLSVLL